MNRITGTQIIVTAPEPIETQEQLNEWIRVCGIDGALESLRLIISDLEGITGVSSENLQKVAVLVAEAEQIWRPLAKIIAIHRDAAPWPQKPELLKAILLIIENRKDIFDKLYEQIIDAFQLVYAESAEAGFHLSTLGKRHMAASRKGGESSARARQSNTKDLYEKIREHKVKLMQSFHPASEHAGILAEIYQRTPRQIRTILSKDDKIKGK